MLRRLVRIASIFSLLLGFVLLVWLPFSYSFVVGLNVPLVRQAHASVNCASGVLVVDVVERTPAPGPHPLAASFARISEMEQAFGPSEATDMTLRPKAFQCDHTAWPDGRFAMTTLAVPLWLVAAIAVLWPIGLHLVRALVVQNASRESRQDA